MLGSVLPTRSQNRTDTEVADCEFSSILFETTCKRLVCLSATLCNGPPQVEDDYLAKLQECLGVVRSLNKSDILTLASKFGSLKAVCDASASELALCPGLGDKKVLRLHETLHEPLSLQKAKKRQREES